LQDNKIIPIDIYNAPFSVLKGARFSSLHQNPEITKRKPYITKTAPYGKTEIQN